MLYCIFQVARQYTYIFSLKISHPAMTCARDIIAISGLAIRVYIAYKDAPADYRFISEGIAALQVLIDKVALHFKGTTISSGDRHDGQRILEGCQSALEDLNELIEKYKRLASINMRHVFNSVKLGKNNITALHVWLISNTGLLNGFVQRCVFSASLILWILIPLFSCQYTEVQVQLAALLDLDGTTSKISIASIASLEMAYKQFCNDLSQIGVTEDVIRRKGDRILEILKSQGIIASSRTGSSDKDQVPETAYHEYCKHLYKIGFTEDLIPPKARILEILRSRSVNASSQSGDRNTKDERNTKDDRDTEDDRNTEDKG